MTALVKSSEELLQGLKDKIRQFPDTPGVYLMKNEATKIIYIGKAKNLKARVRSYFSDRHDNSPKTRHLVTQIREIDYFLTQTEVEAFLLEASLIKKHRPKFNMRLKDDKAYPYVKIGFSHEYPRLYVSRKVSKDGGHYYGPYSNGGAVYETIRFLNRTFKIRDCGDHVFKIRTRPCMTHQIGRCEAPCVKQVTQDNYKIEIEKAELFLRGETEELMEELQKKMKNAALEEKFEVAARTRDAIQAVEHILEKQTVIQPGMKDDVDVIGTEITEAGAVIQTLHLRKGRLIGMRPHFFSNLTMSEDIREWIVSFVNQYYDENFIPDRVILGVRIGKDLRELLANVLIERRKKKVKVYDPDYGFSDLVALANHNAKAQLEKRVSETEEKKNALVEIQDRFSLPTFPRRLECFDISTFQGKETVASQVVYIDGLPSKDHYRRYRIKTVIGTDDFASMNEVLSRRFSHENEEDPDLLVIDGGKGQLQIAVKVLEEKNKKIPVVGLAKARTQRDFKKLDVDATEERFYLPNRANPVIFKTSSEAFRILTSLRDEAHRFAITYHRLLREKGMFFSKLDEIDGLGEKRKQILLSRFESLDAIKGMQPAAVAEETGFPIKLCEDIIRALGTPNAE